MAVRRGPPTPLKQNGNGGNGGGHAPEEIQTGPDREKFKYVLEYLENRNIKTAEDFKIAGVEFLGPEEVQQVCDILGFGGDHPARLSQAGVAFRGVSPTTDGLAHVVLVHYATFLNKAIRHRFSVTPTFKDGRAAPHTGAIFLGLPDDRGSWENTKHGEFVVIAEAVAKAISAVHAGFPALGMGGIYNFSAGSGSGGEIVGAFHEEIWHKKALKPLIVFDSLSPTNAESRRDVETARQLLGSRLLNEGLSEEVYYVELPPPSDPQNWKNGSWGLDDFARVNGIAAVAALLRNPIKMEAGVPEDEVVEELNARYEWNTPEGKALDLATGSRLSETALRAALKNRTLTVESKRRAGKGRTRAVVEEVNVFDLWMSSPRRNQVDGTRFAPGKPRHILEAGKQGSPIRIRNTWQGFKYQPWETEAERVEARLRVEKNFTSLVRRMYSYHDPVTKEVDEKWGNRFLDIQAFNFQHPEEIPDIFPFVEGLESEGKGYSWKPTEINFGDHYATTDLTAFITSKFNSELETVRILVIHESPETLSKAEEAALTLKIKELVDSQRAHHRVEGKGLEAKNAPLNLFIVMLGNHGPAFNFRAQGIARRMEYYKVTNGMGKMPEEERARYWEYVNSEVGQRDILTMYIERDLSGFNPHARAKTTPWMRELINRSLGRSVPMFIEALAEDFEEVLLAMGVPEGIVADLSHVPAKVVMGLFELVDVRGRDAGVVTLKGVGTALHHRFDYIGEDGEKVQGNVRIGSPTQVEAYPFRELRTDAATAVAAIERLRIWIESEGRKY